MIEDTSPAVTCDLKKEKNGRLAIKETVRLKKVLLWGFMDKLYHN
ncbi:MAG: hypothetical protein NT096_15990 [Proteobacteria bacterium]|nr:hypothetical protein [Pseudomonadota bacterium]HUT83062.1 hypothetical protein [Thermodesulfobacteriota bacterium]